MDSTQPTQDAPFDTDLECYCRHDDVLDLLAGKYAIQVICLVGAIEPARYAEIEDRLTDVSSSTLSARLEELTEAGILHRERYAEIPPRVEYSVTEAGEDLCELLVPVFEWADRHGR